MPRFSLALAMNTLTSWSRRTSSTVTRFFSLSGTYLTSNPVKPSSVAASATSTLLTRPAAQAEALAFNARAGAVVHALHSTVHADAHRLHRDLLADGAALVGDERH